MTADRIAPIDQGSLRESVYQALRDAFSHGKFAPGESVSLRSLAAQLDVSVTPVREAVRRLVAEGALIDTRSRTLLVPPFSARRVSDLKSARLALETLVLDQAMERIDAEGIARLKAILAAPPKEGITGPDPAQNEDFHFTLYGYSGSEVLLPMVQALWVQYGAYLNLIVHHSSVRDQFEHEHHHEIIKALESGDRPRARAALIEDIERSFRVLNAN